MVAKDMQNTEVDNAMKTYLNGIVAPDRAERMLGALSGETFIRPDVNSGYPVAAMIDKDGSIIEAFQRGSGYPDVRSHRLKLGVLIPATNCIVESEMWDVILSNRDVLPGVGLHMSTILTTAPNFGTAEELEIYKRVFNKNVISAANTAMLAEPQYLIMGFSMEHFYATREENAAQPRLIEQRTGLSMATWAKAAPAALHKFGARRIGLLCPFDPTGLANAVAFFGELGFEVVSAVGLGCASGVDVGHVPDSYKERAIREHLLDGGGIDAIVQCGSNLSSIALAERLEPEMGIPLIGINAATLWYALRENGFAAPLHGCSRLLREF